MLIDVYKRQAVSNSKLLDDAVEELTLIAGQKPVITKAKKSIAGFKLREGMPIGCKVTDVYKRQLRHGPDSYGRQQ